MNIKEKILLVQLFLKDIRGNWGGNAEERALKAKSLCEEIANESSDNEYLILADNCDVYISSSKRWDDWDGRFFRQPFPMGYENMEVLHGLKSTYKDKTQEFKLVVEKYLTIPNLLFDDLAETINKAPEVAFNDEDDDWDDWDE